jgi:hypothetical protein
MYIMLAYKIYAWYQGLIDSVHAHAVTVYANENLTISFPFQSFSGFQSIGSKCELHN